MTTADLLAELVKRSEEDEILDQMNAAFARQREDSDAWAAERAERDAWEATLIDGLAKL